MDSSLWRVKDIVEFLQSGEADICFSDYARIHIDRMIDAGKERNARNYHWAIESLELFADTKKIMFSHLTSAYINRWIKSLEHTKRAKEMYPICLRQIFKAAVVEYNDYDTGMIRIKTNSWIKVAIPEADRPEKLAISPEAARAFFSAPLPESKMAKPTEEIGRDVAMLVLCLAGINTVDLFNLRKTEYYDRIIHYHRAKTRFSRGDEAYMEMRVPAVLLPLFDKYASEDEYLFNFHGRYATSDSFNASASAGIKRICASMGIKREDSYSPYTFRHTWGTIAQNDCGASVEDIAFAMNHASAHKVTRGYLKMDFSPAWELNDKVVELVFFSEQESRHEEREDSKSLRLSAKYLVRGEMYFRGKLLHAVEDIGYNNKEEVVDALRAYIPEDVPDRAMLLFRNENRGPICACRGF